MFSASNKIVGRVAKHAFTLIEVMLAVAILAIAGVSIYGFLEAHIRAIQISTENGKEDTAIANLIALLQVQMNDLPTGKQGALQGMPHKFNNLAADEITWVTGAGNGLLTKHASGEYSVTLKLKPDAKTGLSELCLERIPVGSSLPAITLWVPLMNNVSALEIRYFDGRSKTWVEKWTDQAARPSLLRVRISQPRRAEPYEAIITLPLTRLAQTGGTDLLATSHVRIGKGNLNEVIREFRYPEQ